jgi:hypothetical protein
MLNPATSTATSNVALGNYSLQGTSAAINFIALPEIIGTSGVANVTPPPTDFFGNPRPDPANTTHVDVGAVEFQPSGAAVLTVTPTSLAFGNQLDGVASASQTLTLSNNGGAAGTGIAVAFASTPPGGTSTIFSRPGGAAGGTCTAT